MIHDGQPVLTRGKRVGDADAAMILVHGRGANAESILTLVPELTHPQFAYLAPQASGNTWYPYPFMQPIERNEPHLSSALATLDRVLTQVIEAGIPAERIILLGFSQGACLATEFAARNARRYGGVVGFSGGLIGPDGTPRDYPGLMDGTPVFLGCSDVDSHIPKERVEETADVFRRLGANVTMRLYPNMEHTINQDEIAFVRSMVSSTVADRDA